MESTCGGPRAWLRLASLSTLVLVLGLAPLRTASAEDDAAGREIAAAQQRVRDLLEKAERLRALGDLHAARELVERAEVLQKRLDAYFEGRDRARAKRDTKPAERRGMRSSPDVIEALEGGIKALVTLGRHEEAARLERILADVREDHAKLHRDAHRMTDRDREASREHLEVMRLAKSALLEGDRKRLAEMLQLAIRAHELELEGRTDEEAAHIRAKAPNRENTAELLLHAAALYREFKLPERAERCEALGRALMAAPKAVKVKVKRRGGDKERKIAERRMKILRYAFEALMDADRPDAADHVEHAIHALELALAGRGDEEAMEIRESAPTRAQQAELMMLAAEILADRGASEKAQAVGKLGRELAGVAKREKRAERERAQPDEESRHRMEELQHRFRAIQEQLERLQAEMETLRRDMRR